MRVRTNERQDFKPCLTPSGSDYVWLLTAIAALYHWIGGSSDLESIDDFLCK